MDPYLDAWRAGSIAFDVLVASRAPPRLLHERQARRMSALLQVALRESRFYRARVRTPEGRPLRLDDFPVVTKAELMHRFDDWVADPRLRLDDLRRFTADPSRIGEAYLGEYLVWESSGSSGEAGVFVQDEAALAVYDALETLRRPALQPMRRLFDPWYAGERVAFVGATTGHFASTVSVSRLRRLNPWLASTTRSVSFLQPARDLVSQLNEHRTTILATYPTVALMLAGHALAGTLQLSLKEIWTGGEGLTATMRSHISRSFGCPVSQSYGASEFFTIASECRCGGLHLNSDWVILESVDEHHCAVPIGSAGSTTLLTNLANHVQPLIRYDLGDRITFQALPCPCGSALPVIEVQGRVDDVLVLIDAHDHAVPLLPLALTTVLEDEAAVFDFQLRQTGKAALLLRIGAGGSAGAENLKRAQIALKRFLGAQGLAHVSVRARCGAHGLRARSGKVQRVVGLDSSLSPGVLR